MKLNFLFLVFILTFVSYGRSQSPMCPACPFFNPGLGECECGDQVKLQLPNNGPACCVQLPPGFPMPRFFRNFWFISEIENK